MRRLTPTDLALSDRSQRLLAAAVIVSRMHTCGCTSYCCHRTCACIRGVVV